MSIKPILDFSINTSVLVGIAIYSLVRITEISSLVVENEFFAIFVFFGTILGYNFLKYGSLLKMNFNLIKTIKSVLLVTILSVVGAVYYYVQLEPKFQLYIAILTLLVFVYPLLRQGVFKIILVSIVVTAITAFVPFLNTSEISMTQIIYITQRFCIVLAFLIPVEIVDLQVDDTSLQTLPQQIGVKYTKIVGLLMVFLFISLEFFNRTMEMTSILIAIITALCIVFSSPNKSNYYTSFWVESIPIFWLGLLWICKYKI